MRPWRDIFSNNAWTAIVQNTDAHAENQSSIKPQHLAALTALIESYHKLPKTDMSKLNERVNSLGTIRSAVDTLLKDFKIDEQKAKERYSWSFGNYVPLSKDKATGRWDSARHTMQSLERNLLTLKNRSARKAQYLKQLQAYYSKTDGDPEKLINLLQEKRASNLEVVALVPGVRLESLDPWHRTVELELDHIKEKIDDVDPEISMERSFARWYQTLKRHQTPFFLWLEGDEYCTADDKGLIYHNASVAYVDQSTGFETLPQRFKLCLVFESGGRLWLDELKSGFLTKRLASTSGYECDAETKGVAGAAAYVWTQEREILIAQHSPSAFHHSSFMDGSAVRCAGMIKMESGMISYVSNNSGHYKPTKSHLHTFVSTMAVRGLVRFDCIVSCFGVHIVDPKTKQTAPYQNLATHFIKNIQNLTA